MVIRLTNDTGSEPEPAPIMNSEVEEKEEAFNKVFETNYLEYGEGHIFEWNGEEYTTNLEKQGETVYGR